MHSILFSFLAFIIFMVPNINFSRAESNKETLESFKNIKIPNTDINFGKRQSYPDQVPPIGPLMNRSIANTYRLNAITKKKQIFAILHKIPLLDCDALGATTLPHLKGKLDQVQNLIDVGNYYFNIVPQLAIRYYKNSSELSNQIKIKVNLEECTDLKKSSQG
ncbi:MAG: hypothetical protein CMK56_08540 [Proteobacteria bacterium]|nr:hypothetical protein [Pseudomonadota bacterium]